MLESANAKSVQIKFYSADRLPCFGCQMFKKWPFKLAKNAPDSSREWWVLGLANRASSRYFQSDQKHSDIYLEVISLQNRKSFEYFFRFHQTLGISPKDLEGFKADIAFIYTTLACSLAISTNLNFDLTSFGLYFIRCAFWLVSRKDDCLESVLRKSFWIKKLINKIHLHLSN